MSIETRTGGCFCGQVKFTAKGEPLNVRACHCKDCQRFTGSAFFVRGIFPKSSVVFTGELSEFPSSDDVVRKFCPKCGSQIFGERKSRPDAMAIALGTFDDLKGLAPTAHIWIDDKQDWLPLPSGVERFAQSPI